MISTLMGHVRDKYTADAANLTNVLSNGDFDVEIRDSPWEHGQIHYGITVWWPDRIGEDRGANKLDDFVYPIMVTMIQGKAGGADSLNDYVDEFWLRSLALHHNQRITADSQVLRSRVKMGRVIIPKDYRDEAIASQLAVVVQRRHLRT